VSAPLEGARRPGHFRGVATVVAKLLNVFQPERAYFGQKDAQQVAVIRRMVQDLSFPVELVVCPIVREEDGLALSSRNAYFGADERRAAPALHCALEAARAAFDSGERDAGRLRAILTKTLAGEPLVQEDYVSVADAATLAELERVEGAALVSLAARIGKTRLIDNVVLGGT
jgi:pantoate--beta-alanine ligase